MSPKGLFKDIDLEDIEDLLDQISNSFSIEFVYGDFNHVKTFGEFCDVIVGKIRGENSDDCTSQQAFYKLKQAISKEFGWPVDMISTKLLLTEIFPKKDRRSKVKQLENHLGFKLDLLVAPYWVTCSLALLLLSSFGMFFFSWKIALVALGLSIFLLSLSNSLGNHLALETLGQLSKSVTNKHYTKVRRKENTVNRREVEEIIKDWFIEVFCIEREDLNKETQLI
ncbi:hypothetical protein VRU48_10685 [Pedobacter sp. KR3-3]|uniref:Acyl carrier protein n=1 Tax=Pedobacter albus TaxID=3113905 RepID=A0ABU7I7X3_9SPHI|nr:hypothetical protein [Pedobacter sp. KR3-3]MEE1945572.1 hypothetical protein [Pedobacter sp. KR3-3]